MRGRWTVLLGVAGCHLFSNGSKSSERAGECSAPDDPALIGIAPELRNDVAEAMGRGVVVFRYRGDGCSAKLEVDEGCRSQAAYRYVSETVRRSAVIQDEVQLFNELPLHAGGLSKALKQHGALRVDEEVVGSLRAGDDLARDRSSLSGDCEDATHLAITIDVGGASLIGGPPPTVSSARNWFLRPTTSKTNPAPLQYLGRVSICRQAESEEERTPGCDHPLRVHLVPIATKKKMTKPKRLDGRVVTPPPPRTREVETVAIPAGEFRMGSAKAKNADGPQHPVELGAFEIDATEVPVSAYATCVAAGGCTPAAVGRFCTSGVEGKESHPINCVTWKQAVAYCAFMNKRLPTEAEWERAARGTDARRFVWGNDWPPPRGSGNLADRTMQQGEPEWRAIPGYEDGNRHTAPVGFARNEDGIYDLAGNVMEWTADWFDPHAYAHKKVVDPKGPPSGKARAVRGGSFGHALPEDLEVTHRFFYLEDFESAHIGFRCAR